MPFENLPAQFTGTGSIDIIIVIVLFIGALLYGFFLGRNKLVLGIIATYLALVLFPMLPFIEALKGNIEASRAYAVDIGIFLGLIILFFLLFQRSLVRAVVRTPRMGDGGLIHIGIFSILAMGLVLAHSYAFLPGTLQSATSPILKRIIFSQAALFWWTIAPLAGLLLIRGKTGEK